MPLLPDPNPNPHLPPQPDTNTRAPGIRRGRFLFPSHTVASTGMRCRATCTQCTRTSPEGCWVAQNATSPMCPSTGMSLRCMAVNRRI